MAYVVECQAADEDYVDFGTMEGFTNGTDWCIIEKVKRPTGAVTGWHFFRGRGWEDKTGDVAIQISATTVYAWVMSGGWRTVQYDASFLENTWYTICLQYHTATTTLQLYVDGVLRAENNSVSAMNDSGNTNKLFFGGQDVDPIRGVGDLYSETDIIIGHQAWLQRTLALPEIEAYDGSNMTDPSLFFETNIGAAGITDDSGNGHNGTNGNSPEYYLSTYLSTYLVECQAADEDYVDFGTMEGFTNGTDWCIIEKVKRPTGAVTGWHFFRGRGWEDKTGDVAIQISATTVYAWVMSGGWRTVQYDASFLENTWYTICLQYHTATTTLQLYVDGVLRAENNSVSAMNDSGNTNKLFFGGQDVDPIRGVGDLYSETDIIIGHQAWLQRTLALPEIEAYDGSNMTDPSLFFETNIGAAGITDDSGNGHDGTNGNSPEYYLSTY